MSELGKKLHIKPGQRVAIINAPIDLAETIGFEENDVVISSNLSDPSDLILCFVTNSQTLNDILPSLLEAQKPESSLWIAYPKKSSGIKSDLSRDDGWNSIDKIGLRPVASISVDRTWSAVRFRPKSGKTEEELINNQFQGRKAVLRPIFDCVVEVARNLGDDIDIVPRKSYVAFVRGKQFAVIKPSTITRIDVGFKLKGFPIGGRSEDAGNFGNGSITHKVSLFNVDDVDGELRSLLRQAYEGVV